VRRADLTLRAERRAVGRDLLERDRPRRGEEDEGELVAVG